MRDLKSSLLLVLALALTLAACGGSESPEDQVTAAANEIITAQSPEEIEQVCGERITSRFLKEVYGGQVKSCIDQPVNDESDIEDPGEVSVDSVEVSDSKADAMIVTTGGETDGNDGTWTFVKEDDGWKLDRLGDDYLRSAFAVSIEIVDQGLVSYEPMRKCMAAQVRKLSSSKLRDFMFETSRGQKEKATNSILEIAGRCPLPMAHFVANELARKVLAKKDVTPGQIRCAKKKLVPLLMATDLSSIALGSGDYGDASAYALAGLIAAVVRQCPPKGSGSA
jgi:hypothetical protein